MICLMVNLKVSEEEKEESNFLTVYGFLGLLPETEGRVELSVRRIILSLWSCSSVVTVWTQLS